MPILQKNPEMTANVFDKADDGDSEAVSKKGIYCIVHTCLKITSRKYVGQYLGRCMYH